MSRLPSIMRALRNQGRAPGDTWLQHTHLGYNYRLDEMSAALGRVQMERLDELLAKRAQVADWYSQRLSEHPRRRALLQSPPPPPARAGSSTWCASTRRRPRPMIARRWRERGIPARPYFSPIHLQPYMVERFGFQPGDFPVTEDLGRQQPGAALLGRDDRGAGGAGVQDAFGGAYEPIHVEESPASHPARLQRRVG